MPYAIKGPDGTLVHVEVDESKEFTWDQFRAATGSMTDEAGWKKQGYTCVPVTVSEGEVEKLLVECLYLLNETTASWPQRQARLAAEIDAYLKGKP